MISEESVKKLASANNVKITEMKEGEENQFNRSINGGSMSFSRSGLTIFTDNTMVKVETIINKEARSYGAFIAKSGDKDLLISANSVIRRLYTEDGDATNEVWQVKDIAKYGDSPKEIITNLISQKKAVKFAGTKPLYAPRFVNGEAVYTGMIKRNYPTFEVVDAQ